MLTLERKQLLLRALKDSGRIVAKDVSAKLRLSEDTIRRDLRELAAEGLLQRVHGGALPASPSVANLASRRTMSAQDKANLARVGAKFIRTGDKVFIDGGTTNHELIRALATDLVATVFTHSPNIAVALEPFVNIEVILLGGKLFRHSMVSVGAATLQGIGDLRVDTFFLGVTGIHVDEGLTTGDYEEAIIKRAICARAAEVITLATTEKLGTASAHRIVALEALTTLVVNKGANVKSIANHVRVVKSG
jgi:DeoR/GlpR family transcriptional regulator of sugar metabolism